MSNQIPTLPCCTGGEFFSHLRYRAQLSEPDAKIYAAEVVLAFEYLHQKDYAYRDLKVGLICQIWDGLSI